MIVRVLFGIARVLPVNIYYYTPVFRTITHHIRTDSPLYQCDDVAVVDKLLYLLLLRLQPLPLYT